MPLYVVERQFAERFEASSASTDKIRQVIDANEITGVEWLFSFLSADRKKTYCLYEAASPEAIFEAARLAGIPADKVVEVDRTSPEAFGFPESKARIHSVGPAVRG